ncbi:MAG TPA: hypothetical protein PKE37_05665 [Thiomonas arsenitoxydans]|uniref:hypothetical protein n=1 Tax=Thiomonas TaxID=32012 RepID=UPI00257FCDE8|nr:MULTISPECIES: hypothetical protein [Thiomonas]HML81239.1 hypothetical protein [Thiomonas arsenitoxydans]
MRQDSVLFKTEKGQDEIAKRAVLQSRVLRNVLLLVDCKRNVQTLRELMQAISAPEDALEQLLALELIAAPKVEDEADSFLHDDDELPSELALEPLDVQSAKVNTTADFSSLYEQINGLVSSHLGMIKAYGLQLRIEQCQTPDQLLALLPEIKAALVAKHGEPKAINLLRQLGR